MTKLLRRSPRYWLHGMFAHPFCLTWIVGSIGLWIPLSLQFHEAGVFDSITADCAGHPIALPRESSGQTGHFINLNRALGTNPMSV
jgi:hypothetical protein